MKEKRACWNCEYHAMATCTDEKNNTNSVCDKHRFAKSLLGSIRKKK